MNETTPPKTALACVAVALLGVAILTGCATSRPTADSRESIDKSRPDWLPAKAQMVFSSRWEDGFLGDATIKIKARVTEKEFLAAVRQLELTPHTADRQYADGPPQWIGDRDQRWDPPETMTGAFIRQEGRWWQIAKYERGFLYYESIRY